MNGERIKNTLAKAWTYTKRVAATVRDYLKIAKMELIVMIGVFALDLVSKQIVESLLSEGESAPIIPYFLNAHMAHNFAAVFGSNWAEKMLGTAGARIFFSVFAVAASVTFMLVLIRFKGKSKWLRVALALFVAGAMGNCIDRMFLGCVRDFLEFEYFGLTIFGRTTWQYIFNVADVALVTAVIMLTIYYAFMYRDPDKITPVEAKAVESPAVESDGADNAAQENDAIGDEIPNVDAGDDGKV